MRIPVMLSGERTSTFVEPGRTVYGRLVESDMVEGVIDPSLWVGYVWADQPRTNATVVVSGTDVAAIYAECRKIGQRYWHARHEFGFGVPTGPADWTIEQALAQDRKAVIISDSGDNPTAGGAGDIPYMVERLLAHDAFRSADKTAIVAAVPSPEAVTRCVSAGIGAEVSVTIGGVLDPVNGAPLEVTGTVHAIQKGDPVGGDIAVVRSGGVHVIIPTRRKPYHRLADFAAVDLRVAEHDVTVVKIGYLEPELREVASAAFMALTPGAVNQDIPSLPYQRVQRPIFPIDPDMGDPELPVTIFAPLGS
jgi:microcystin degradation protein MlrC